MRQKIESFLLIIFLSALMGCSHTTSLQCGVDGNSSYVTVEADKNQPARIYKAQARLCNFTTTEKGEE